MRQILVSLILFGAVTRSAVAAPTNCDFCNLGVMQLGTTQVSAFERPPNTTNFFSSVVLDQSEHFVLKVTRGAFIPFYFLIISKEHYVRMADLPPDVFQDLQQFKSHVERFYREVLQTPFVVFEHGPSVAGSRGEECTLEGGGGCVDHLHLHILPFSGEIESSPDLNLPNRFESPRTLSNFNEMLEPQLNGTPYIFYQNPNEQMHLYKIIGPTPSQLLRLLIAESLHIDEEFNWRDFADKGDFWANAAQSVAGYSTWMTQGAATARSKILQKNWDKRVSGDFTPVFSGNCETLLAHLEQAVLENPLATMRDLKDLLRK